MLTRIFDNIVYYGGDMESRGKYKISKCRKINGKKKTIFLCNFYAYTRITNLHFSTYVLVHQAFQTCSSRLFFFCDYRPARIIICLGNVCF